MKGLPAWTHWLREDDAAGFDGLPSFWNCVLKRFPCSGQGLFIQLFPVSTHTVVTPSDVLLVTCSLDGEHTHMT